MSTADSQLDLRFWRDGRKYRVEILMGDKVLHIDVCDLCSESARTKFLDTLAKKFPGIKRDDIEARLLQQAASSANPHGDAGETVVDPLDGTPPDIIAEATAILDNPDLLQRVCSDVEGIGVAGERELVATIFLVGISRLLPRPLAGIIRGSSSSGKSYIVERVAKLFPPETLVHATQMTPQALFHMPRGSLANRWVVAGERSRLEDDDKAEATRALREMLASGKLSKLMPVKTSNGIETQIIEQDRPIAFTETTTLTSIFEEDANRCLLLQTDETREQTKRIIASLARQQNGESIDTKRVIHVYHALQRMLPRSPVRVPFASRLASAFACDRVEVRRAFPQLIGMIQASALLHHRQRDRTDDGAILSDVRDYHIARLLIVKPFGMSLGGGLSESARAFFNGLPQFEAQSYTVKAVAKLLKVSRSAAQGFITELSDIGVIEIEEPGKGRQPSKWRTIGRLPEKGENTLPTVEAIFPPSRFHPPGRLIPQQKTDGSSFR